MLESRRTGEDLTKENADLKSRVTEQERVLSEYDTLRKSNEGYSQQHGGVSASRDRSLSPMALGRAHLPQVSRAPNPTAPAPLMHTSSGKMNKEDMRSPMQCSSRSSMQSCDENDDNVATPPMMNNKRKANHQHQQQTMDILSVASPIVPEEED